MADPNEGTYADEDPNAGVVERTINSVKKMVGLPKDPTKMETSNPSDSGNSPQESADAKLGRMKQAQSSDRDNSYSY